MEYIASFSGGKDSTATIILAHLHNEPLDEIIFSEVMFDENTSGELPEHIDFIKNKAIRLFDKWGYKTKILHSDKTYMDMFNKVVTRSKVKERNGKKTGFPMAGRCCINSRCKIKPIKDFYKEKNKEEITQYIGIAIDEPKRLQRLQKEATPKKISLLEKYGYTEDMAFKLCEEYGLLSPIYEYANRGGCWFCPNMTHKELKYLRAEHRELWNRLLQLEKEPDLVGNIWNGLTKTSMEMNEEKLMWEERQMTIWDYMESDS